MSKALTVRHPWAWAIIEGGKDVENRSRRTNYRGPLYIHAGKTVDFEALLDPVVESAVNRYAAANSTGSGLHATMGKVDLRTVGMVLGVVDLVGCHRADDCNWEIGDTYCSRWAFPNSWHWVLRNPRPLEIPFNAKGKLGIWNLDTEEGTD